MEVFKAVRHFETVKGYSFPKLSIIDKQLSFFVFTSGGKIPVQDDRNKKTWNPFGLYS